MFDEIGKLVQQVFDPHKMRDHEGNALVSLDAIGDVQQYVKRGSGLIKQGEYTRARAIFENAIALDPQSAAAHTGHGEALYHLAQYDEALASLSQAITLKADHARAYTLRGIVHQVLHHWDDALQDFDRAVELTTGTDYVPLLNRGIVRGNKKMIDEGLSDLNRALGLVSQKAIRAVIYYHMGTIKAGEGLYEQAIQDYSRSITADPEKLYTYEGRARIYFAQNRYQQAIADWTHIFADEPDVMPLLYRAQAYWRSGDEDNALADYHEAVKLFPDSAPAHSARGYYRAASGELDEALADANYAIEIAPEAASGYTTRGYIHFLKGDFEQSLLDFEQAIAVMDTDDQLPPIGKAAALHRLGRAEEAIAIWHTIQDLDPRLKDADQFTDYLPVTDAFSEEIRKVITAAS